jgi:hypothetical protein
MRRPDLVPECGSCAALCCVAPSFERSNDFACDKPAGERCQHLTHGDGCSIHALRADRGFRGCIVYDCYGAGQRVTRAFGSEPSPARDRVFLAARDLHELLFMLTEATSLCPAEHSDLRGQLDAEIAALDRIADPEHGIADHRAVARALLRRVGTALGGRRLGSYLPVIAR